MEFRQEVLDRIRAGFQVLMVTTTEESRCEKELSRIVDERNRLLTDRRNDGHMKIVTWSSHAGFEPTGPDRVILNPAEAIMAIMAEGNVFPHNCLFVMYDLGIYLFHDPAACRALKYYAQRDALSNKKRRRPIVIVQQSQVLPDILNGVVVDVPFPLPSMNDLREEVESVQKGVDNKSKSNISDDFKHKIVQGLRGLTAFEAANCLSLCTVRHEGFVPEMLETIESVKAETLKSSEVLTYTPKDRILQADQIGGYEELEDFVRQRALAYTPEADSLGLDMPKGIVIAGVPGTGKSKAAQVIARLLELPLVTFDFSAVFNSMVGASERRTREAIDKATALGGCVLLIDEADKAMGNVNNSIGDSGVTLRVFGKILTWLADKNDRTFVVLTANRVKVLPPELTRRGRFDEIFYVDLPSAEERAVIFNIHLRKRGVQTKYSKAELADIISRSEHLTGAEIEQAVISARFAAFQADRSGGAVPSTAQLLYAIDNAVQTCVYNTDRENLKEIQEWGAAKARPVSKTVADRKRGKLLRQPGRSVDLGLSDN